MSNAGQETTLQNTIPDSLDVNNRDRLVSAIRGVSGALPWIGSSVGEVVGSLVPDLRIDRIVSFVRKLELVVRLLDDKISTFEMYVKTEEGCDLLEEGMVQASRSVSRERLTYIANIVGHSLCEEKQNYPQSKKLLNIFRDLADEEIILLIYNSETPTMPLSDFHKELREKYPELLEPAYDDLGQDQSELDRSAIAKSYTLNLDRLGLIQWERRRVELTQLGHLLLRYIDAKYRTHHSGDRSLL